MKKPGTKLWKLVAADNRETTWERRYYNGELSRESIVGSQESIEPWRHDGTEMHRECEYRTIKQGISNDEGREATKAERREGTQSGCCAGLQGKRNHGVKTALRCTENGNIEQ